jgi:hypothetical protein
MTTSIPSAARDPDRRRDRRQVPGDVLVGDSRRRPKRRAWMPTRSSPLLAVQLPAPGGGRSGRRSVRGAPTPAVGGWSSSSRWIHFGSSARARGSRSRGRAGVSRSSASSARPRPPPAGSRARRSGPSRNREAGLLGELARAPSRSRPRSGCSCPGSDSGRDERPHGRDARRRAREAAAVEPSRVAEDHRPRRGRCRARGSSGATSVSMPSSGGRIPSPSFHGQRWP